MSPQHHEQLEVWQQSIELAIAVHWLVAGFTADHRIAYGDQLRRAAVSVAANIAEGAARHHRTGIPPVPRRFTRITRRTANAAGFAERLSLADPQVFQSITIATVRIAKMLTSLTRAIRGSG